MLIERLVVEGGFLDGLDLPFRQGLNTLIGGRGTGKTSIVELLRFCLDVSNYTDSSAKRSREHALAILQDGQVSVICSHDGMEYTFTRTAGSRVQRLEGAQLPIMFSQTDIEQLGMEAPGRLNLIDHFLDVENETSVPNEIVSTVVSLTAQMQNLAREIESLSAQLTDKHSIESELQEITSRESALLKASDEAQSKQAALRTITDSLATINAASDLSRRTAGSIQEFAKRMSSAISAAPLLERWQTAFGPADRLALVRSEFQNAIATINSAMEQLRSAGTHASEIEEQLRSEKLPLEQAARQLRGEIEGLQEGAGSVSRQASLLREKLTHLSSIETMRQERRERLMSLQAQRGKLLDRMEWFAQQTFERRVATVNQLNNALAPRIRLRAIRSAQIETYAAAISNSLRGSGLKYSEISTEIASRISPRELTELVENVDFDELCLLTDISRDRAVRIISRLREVGLESILNSPVEDDVELSLLHGNEYKPIDRLSTGQRCTAVLPIVMEHRDRIIVVDQPEDHLDNEFITDTLIRSLRKRGSKSQIIFSTHNANIPVLGEADCVIHLASDGQRGFVEHAGALGDDEIVSAITNVMEGGREAFDRRASFYASHRESYGS